MFQHFRPLYQGHLIANVDMTQERANRLIEAGLADSIAFGRPYIANPDLPERFPTGAKLNEVSWPTVYASVDYRRLLHLIRGLEAYPPPLIRGRNCT